MNFILTSEQEAFRKMAREFADREIVPISQEMDEFEIFPAEILNKMNAVGLFNLSIPEEYGGVGVDSLSYSIIMEEIARGCAGVATVVNGNALSLYPLLLGGSEEQKERFLPKICDEGLLVSFCLTEPNAGSDASSIATTAHRDGNDYIINGSKCFITNAAHAYYHTVFAKVVDGNSTKKPTVFMVEAAAPGVSIGKKEKKMGMRCSETSEVIFEDVRVTRDNLIGKEGEGLKLMLMTLDMARPSVAAISVGIAQAAFEAALDYSKKRVQFGRPICKNQSIQFMLADMAAEIQAARLLTYHASSLKDRFLIDRKPITREAAFAKLYATDMAMKVTTDAIQIFGGYGYTKEYLVEKYMRDNKVQQILEGTNQIQRMVISSDILGKAL